MSLKTEQITEPYLFDTAIENIFINDYMTGAPGEYVKVYLLALMWAKMGQDADNEQIARQCGLQEEDVNNAWIYWEKLGAVRKQYINENDRLNYHIEFVSLKAAFYGAKKTGAACVRDRESVDAILSDKEVKAMYRSIEKLIGRPLGGKEPMEIMSWITDFGATPEIVIYGYSYCSRTRKKDSARYVGKVIREWIEKGFKDAASVEEYLQEMDNRYFLYKRVLKALGFNRNATEHERSIMDRWFDEMDYSIDKILEACSKTSGIPNPNINYVNKILENWQADRIKAGETVSGAIPDKSSKGGSIANTLKYYEFLRKQAEQQAADRRAEVFAAVPRIKAIEDELLGCSMNISRAMLSGSANKAYQVNNLKNTAEALAREKEKLLAEAGYEKDYLDVKYRCPICGDTGTTDEGQQCSCFNKIMSEAETWQNPQNL